MTAVTGWSGLVPGLDRVRTDALRVAQECAQAVEEEEERGLLEADLETLAKSIHAPVDGV